MKHEDFNLAMELLQTKKNVDKTIQKIELALKEPDFKFATELLASVEIRKDEMKYVFEDTLNFALGRLRTLSDSKQKSFDNL